MSTDTLFNTSWQVLLAAAGIWWVMFAALLLNQRSAASIRVRERLEVIAARLPKSSPLASVDRWFENLAAEDLTFCLRQNNESRLVGFKWFLGGLLVTGVTFLIAQLVMFGSDTPTPGALDASRLLSKASLVTSGVILAATIITGLVCGAPRAVGELAKPKSGI